MNIIEAMHLDRNDSEKYTKIVKALGEREVYDCLPFNKKEISKAIKTDQALNNLPLKRWDIAAGFYPKANQYEVIGSSLMRLIKAKYGVLIMIMILIMIVPNGTGTAPLVLRTPLRSETGFALTFRFAALIVASLLVSLTLQAPLTLRNLI